MAPQEQDWSWLGAKLSRGEELPQQCNDFVKAGGNPNDMVVSAMGNREQKMKPCPKSLKVLLENKADPNAVEPRVGSPLMHIGAWMSTAEVVSLLIEHKGDMEVGEMGVPTPPLNTALAAGNGPVALLLLNKRANVQWKHDDGATPLHVATAWISDSERSHRRRPPVGDEPREIIEKLLHNGADPSQREGMRGMPLLDAFREGMRTSPWLEDDDIGEEFKATSQKIYDLIEAADQAMKMKAKGNKAFTANNHSEALEHWASGRSALEKCGLAGHHMAVLWSNEANCRKKMGDWSRCRAACESGLGHYCAGSVRAKLEYHLSDCAKQASEANTSSGSKAEPKPASSTPALSPFAKLKAQANKHDDGARSPFEKLRDEVMKDLPVVDKSGNVVSPPTPPETKATAKSSSKPSETQSTQAQAKKDPTKIKKGFFNDVKADKPMYGPEGSVQGINMSSKVMAPVTVAGMQQRMPVEYGKILPITVDEPKPKDEDSD